jgi:penicillin amidase
VVARRLTALLRPLEATDPTVAVALNLIREWDGRVTEDSAAATIFEIWISKHPGKAVGAKAVPESVRDIVGNGAIAAIIDLLEKPDDSLRPDPKRHPSRKLHRGSS